MRKILFAFVLLLCSTVSFAQNFWSASGNAARIKKDNNFERSHSAKDYKLYNLDRTSLRNELFKVVNGAAKRSAVITIPKADGKMEQFEMTEASNFEPALQAKYPEIRCFSGKGITDPTASVRLSISPDGIQTLMHKTGEEDEVIEPYSQDHNTYAVYNTSTEPGELFSCYTEDEFIPGDLKKQLLTLSPEVGNYFTKLPLAISVNSSYAQAYKAEKPADLWPHINNMLAVVNLIFESDLGVRIEAIKESEDVFFYKKETDPYIGITSRDVLLGKINETIASKIEDGKYSLGHLLGITEIDKSLFTGTAGLGCVCTDLKGRAFTSYPQDLIDKNQLPEGHRLNMIMVHEMGHQLGANHTFSHTPNKLPVEPGSGVTIMSYAGNGVPNIRASLQTFFHAKSIEQIKSRLVITKCSTIPITNKAPEASVKNGKTLFNIPQSTPFALSGIAGDDSRFTYSWDQMDLAGENEFGQNSVASPQKLKGPNFVSVPPTSSPVRIFPILPTILRGDVITGPYAGGSKNASSEALSSIPRELNFRFTVRDNIPYNETKAEGPHTSYVDVKVKVGDKGPFKITSPNSGSETWKSGQNVSITWDVANSDKAPVNCSAVRILLSTNGGYTFPYILVESTPNTGTATVTVPSVKTTAARVKVEATGNIFFDICDKGFNIDFGCDLKVQGLTAVIDDRTAVLNWWQVTDAASYDVEFQQKGLIFNGAKFEENTLRNFTTFSHWFYSTGIVHTSTCEWRVRARCSNGGTGEWTAANIKPPACSPPAQEGLIVGGICQTEATFNWEIVPGMTGTYLLWYKEKTAEKWELKELSVSSLQPPRSSSYYTVTNLNPLTTYIWKMECKCDGKIGPDSIVQSFTTK